MCSRRSPRAAPAGDGYRRRRRRRGGAAVDLDRAIARRSMPRCCCCRRAGSSAAAASARGVRAQRRRRAGRGRARRRRRGRRRRARRADRRCGSPRPATPSRRRACSRRPTPGIRFSSALRATTATLGLVTFQNVAAHQRRRLPDAGAVHDRRSGAARLCGRRGTRARAGVGPRQPWNDFPLHATFVPFLHEAVRYLAARARRPAEYLVADAPAAACARRAS